MGLATEYLANWVTEDGGGKLTPTDDEPPIGQCSMRRTNNENPILFLVQAAMEFAHFGIGYDEFKRCFSRHMASTEIEPGLHSRRCGDAHLIRQSHDNIVAMLIGSHYFADDYAERIFQYGKAHLWNFNVDSPDDFDLKSQLQGGDVAIAYFAYNRTPPLLLTLWLGIGLAVSTAYNLCDLRIKFLEGIGGTIPKLHGIILGLSIAIHKRRRGSRLQWIRNYYTNPEHPFRLKAEGEQNA